jgi:hypothetical protein
MNESNEPTGTTSKWTPELMAAHKARLEFMEAMGQSHYSRTDAQWHVAHYAKTVGAELEAEVKDLTQKLETANTENTNLRFTLTVLGERLRVVEPQVHDRLRQVTDLEVLCRRIISDRACVCNMPGHRCGTNLMLEDLERIILRPIIDKHKE